MKHRYLNLNRFVQQRIDAISRNEILTREKGAEMIGFRLSSPRRGCAFAIVAIASCALLVPVKSNAQSDQVIVLSCTNQIVQRTQGQWRVTIDMAAKTVSEFSSRSDAPVPPTSTTSPITQVTDQQIVWGTMSPMATTTKTLNRYTGDLAVDQTIQGTVVPTVTSTCQRQQKQF